MFHSDRGYQYTSKAFKKLLDKHNIVQSMSRVGKCIDNGPIEKLWGIIKSEMYYLESFDSSEKLITAINGYIKFYNQERIQRKSKAHTPLEYRYILYYLLCLLDKGLFIICFYYLFFFSVITSFDLKLV